MLWLGIGILISLLIPMIEAVGRYNYSCLNDRLNFHMKGILLTHVSTLSLEQIESPEVQDIITRTKAKPGENLLNYANGFLTLFASLVRVAGLTAAIYWASPLWALILSVLLIPALVISRYLSKISFELRNNRTTTVRWNMYFDQVLSGRETLPTVRTLGLVSFFKKRFHETLSDITQANRRFYFLRMITTIGNAALIILTGFIAMFFLAEEVVQGQLEIARFSAFLFATWRLQSSISTVGKSFYAMSEAELNIQNIQSLLSLENNMPSKGTVIPKTPCGNLEIRNVSFSYPGSKTPALRDVSFSIHQGETVAIVGANGSGKTTLAKLIAQFYTPTSGAIYLDGIPVEDYDREAFYKQLSFVHQYSILFETTAEENIAYGDWENLAGAKDRVKKVASINRIHDMISAMPNGYETFVGRRFGLHDISGGQAQKMALTRALASQPSMIILDEPTAALDIHTEHELYSGFKDRVQNTTTILISHRFSTIGMADRILVLNEGQLVESGKHEELMKQNGTYATMVTLNQKITTS